MSCKGRERATRAFRCALAALSLVALIALAGCKYSDVLTQHLEDPDYGTLDESADPVYQPNPDSDFILDLAELSIDASDIVDTQVQMLPHYDPNAPDNGPTTQRVTSAETPHDEEATEGEDTESEEEGELEGEGEGETAESGEGEGATGKSTGEKSESTAATQPEDEPEDDPEDEPPVDSDDDPPTDDGSDDNGNNNKGKDDDGKKGDDNDPTVTSSETDGIDGTTGSPDDEKLPTDVNPDSEKDDPVEGTVAAVGELATITQMVGGQGALVACDEQWLSDREEDLCFDGELDDVVTCFGDDGSGACDIDTLIDDVQPSVILSDGVRPELSDSDLEKLEEAGIEVEVISGLGDDTTQDYDIRQAVIEIAKIVNGIDATARGIADPIAQAEAYISYHDEVLQNTYKANEGYAYKITDGSYEDIYQDKDKPAGLSVADHLAVTTVYVDKLLHPSVSSVTLSQNAVVSDTEGSSTKTISLLHDGESVDVSSGIALSAQGSSDQYMLIDYYLQLAGIVNNAYDEDKPDSTKGRYILLPGHMSGFGDTSDYASRGGSGQAFFFNSGNKDVEDNWHWLGQEGGWFPAVLVADEETAGEDIYQALLDSAAQEDGLYRMSDSYRVIVVPSGVAGSWAKGHIDSFLLSFWSLCIRDEEVLDIAADYTSQFYEGFLRCPDWEVAVDYWGYDQSTDSG